MIGGLMKTTSLAALATIASAVVATSAMAADLGGNCCADLEERVAELEATAARKGNRKVKLTVSGQVNEAVIFWDDGSESNAYVVSNNSSRTRFRFVGDAKIDNDWSAGYLLEIGVRYAASNNRSQFSDRAGGDLNAIDIRHSAWWLDNKRLGRIWVGQTSSASDGITEINLANVIASPADFRDTWAGGYRLRRSGTSGQGGLSAVSWGSVYNASDSLAGEGDRNNVVRYVSPTFQGFTFSAAWGEDDMWDVALRYANEFNGVRVAAGIGYRQSHDFNANADGLANCSNLSGSALQSSVDCEQLGMSGSVMHVATGLFVYGAYGQEWDNNRSRLFGTNVKDDAQTWYIQAGIERNWFGIGKTTIYGEYLDGEFGAGISGGAVTTLAATDVLNSRGAASRISSSEVQMWGLGINQSIDAAAMDLYIAYRNASADMKLSATGSSAGAVRSNSIDDWQAVMMGAIIRF